jgi:hypothetical protein
MKKTLWLAVLATALISPAPSVNAAAVDLAEVRACVEQNTPRRSSVMEIQLRFRDAIGETSESRFKIYWRRLPTGERRVLIRFSEPEDLRGAAVLVEGAREARPKVHLYLPDIGRAQRVTSRDQLEGFLGRADLGIEEIGMLLDPVGHEGLVLLDTDPVADVRPSWVLEARYEVDEEEDGSRYARTRTFVDRELCIPLRAVFYDAEDREAKIFQVDRARVTREADAWIPRQMTFRDPSNDSITTLVIDQAEIDVQLAPSLLTVPAMQGAGG